jgi:hypothetical protein
MVTSVKPFSLGNRALIYEFVVERVWKKKEATIERLLASFHRIKLRPITSEPVKLELNSVSFVHFGIDFNKGDVLPILITRNIVKGMRLDIMTKGDSIYEGNSEVIYCRVRHVSQGVVALSEDINGRKNQALFLVI